MGRVAGADVGDYAPDSEPIAAAATGSVGTAVAQRVRWLGMSLALPTLGVIVWDTVTRYQIVSSYLLPSPAQVGLTFMDFVAGRGEGAFSGTFVTHAVASVMRALGGFGMAALVAVPFGVFVGVSRTMERLCDPLIQIFRPIPIFAWLPLSMIWFGLGVRPTLFLVFLGAFFPILINAIIGAKFVEPRLTEAGRMLGMTSRQILFRVIVPASVPSILAGLRVGVAIAWMALVVGEMTGVKEGLGSVLMDARNLLRTDLVIVSMFLIGGLGMLSDRIILLVMGPTMRWAPSARK